MSRDVSRGGCSQEDFRQPVCWRVGPCPCPDGCLAWGIPTLKPTGCWVGPGLGSKMSASRRAHKDESSLICLSPVSMSPGWATAAPPPPQETLQDQQAGPTQAPIELLLLPLVPVHVRVYVHPLRVKSVFPTILWSSCFQALLAFKSKYSGGSSSQCQTPGLGSLMWGSDLSLLWENLCNIIILQFVGHPPRGYGFACIVSLPLLLWFLLYVFSCRRSFPEGFSLFQWWSFCRLWFWSARERRWT